MNTHLRFAVTERSQPGGVRAAARDLAAAAGFDETDEYRAGLVVTELATNLVKHARDGVVLLRALPGTELEVISIDRGPGISDLTASLTDGHSTSGSPGTGLGAIRRLSDDFDIYTQRDRGTIVVARLRAKRAIRQGRTFSVGGVSVSKPDEAVCGDAWHVRYDGDGAVVLVVDGLGHGPLAADAARIAVDSFVQVPLANPADTLQTLHAALRPTRGAAAAIAEIRPRHRVVRFAGVGNVAGQVALNGGGRSMVSLNGTLGHVARGFREYSYPWGEDAVLVMSSDGLGTHWSFDDYRGILRHDPAVVAAALYRDQSRGRDDVTVVVAMEAR